MKIIYFLILFPVFLNGQKAVKIFQSETEKVVSDLKAIGGDLHFSSGGFYYQRGHSCGTPTPVKQYHPKDYFYQTEKEEVRALTLAKLDSNFINKASVFNLGGDKIIITASDYPIAYDDLYLTDHSLSEVIKVENEKLDNPPHVYRCQMVNDKMFFLANDVRGKRQLWSTDGTIEGTLPFYSAPIPYLVSSLVPFKDGLVFSAYTRESDFVLFFKSFEQENLIKFTTFPASSVFISIKKVLHDKIIFHVTFRSKIGSHAAKDMERSALWESDGTIEGTKELVDFKKYVLSYQPIELNEKLYLSVGNKEYHLWETDGTKNGSRKISESIKLLPERLSMMGLCKFKGNLYFIGEQDSILGTQIYYLSDESEVKSITQKKNFNPLMLKVHGNELYFVANTKRGGRELWKIDAKKKKAFQVSKINKREMAFTENPYSRQLWFCWQNKLYFLAKTVNKGYQLFCTDGKKVTQVIDQIGLESPDPDFFSFAEIGEELFFTYGNSTRGYGDQIWKLK